VFRFLNDYKQYSSYQLNMTFRLHRYIDVGFRCSDAVPFDNYLEMLLRGTDRPGLDYIIIMTFVGNYFYCALFLAVFTYVLKVHRKPQFTEFNVTMTFFGKRNLLTIGTNIFKH